MILMRRDHSDIIRPRAQAKKGLNGGRGAAAGIVPGSASAALRARFGRATRAKEVIMRATAYVLISLAAGVARDVYNTLNKMGPVQKVDAVSGPYDMIAVVDGSTFNEIARFVLDEIQKIPGVQDTITCNVIFLEN